MGLAGYSQFWPRHLSKVVFLSIWSSASRWRLRTEAPPKLSHEGPRCYSSKRDKRWTRLRQAKGKPYLPRFAHRKANKGQNAHVVPDLLHRIAGAQHLQVLGDRAKVPGHAHEDEAADRDTD